MGDGKIGGFNFNNFLTSFFGDQNAGNERTKTPQTAQAGEPYVVKSGDTLSKIAAKYGQNLQQVIQKNPQIKNPNRIYTGQKINVGNARSEYVVKNGDTLSGIAEKHDTSVGDILRANPGKINNRNLIYPGQKLKLPQSAEVRTPVKTPKKTPPQAPVVTKQPGTNKTETSVAVETNPQVSANGEYKQLNLDEFLDSRKGSSALAAIVIGNAEGNRTPGGGFTPNYRGHTDPGDKKHNLGSFSYNPRGGGPVAKTPEEADKIYLEILSSRRAKYEKAVKGAGLDPNDSLLASTYFDAANQSPRAGDKMLAQLDYIKKNGVTPETMKEWRFRGYVNHETGQRWAYPGKDGKVSHAGSGFANVFKLRNNGRTPTEAELRQTIRSDQNRRLNAVVAALDAQGYKTSGTNGSSQTGGTNDRPLTPNTPVAAPKTKNGGSVNTVLPPEGAGYVTYSREKNGADQYGTAQTVKTLQTVGERWNQNNKNLPIQIGDISRQGGGKFPPHGAHQTGTNADIRPFRKDGRQLPATWQDANYDREKTRELIRVIKEQYPNVKILFNDPVLIKEGLTHYYKGHDNHLHVDFK